MAVGEALAAERESPLTLTLAQGISRGERMDLVVQKATELGVTRIAPLLTERSVVRLDAAQAARKLRALARDRRRRLRAKRTQSPAAAAAAGHPRGVPARRGQRRRRLLLSPAAALRLAEVAAPGPRGAGAHRPRGRTHGEEQERAQAAGFTGVRLGPRVLRTETAAIAALALLQREFGDL